MGRAVYLYSEGLWQGNGRANRKWSDQTGRVGSQQVVEGGGGINKCCAGGITVLYWWLSVFLEFMQQRLPGFAEVESPISVDVIWMHLNFDGFSENTAKA